jgi:hypothetical protein
VAGGLFLNSSETRNSKAGITCIGVISLGEADEACCFVIKALFLLIGKPGLQILGRIQSGDCTKVNLLHREDERNSKLPISLIKALKVHQGLGG